ncbi:type II toxin-antitoxin system RelE/ParE family toxin [Photorhabdus khanii]|uniref:Type II toxin-antitoxin system RelE/ParE family toxin n=2 Tax=Photorhabdus TaxID=29487 RepID=A0A7C9GLW4_9GAMM|nr:type II toxin-antitoxin system RelE/ParE family toxin [Photorhabdus khanii]MQL50174.1 type II toxin-antitoxin system RelE/ParE family toxin [Photorhabdus khanii]
MKFTVTVIGAARKELGKLPVRLQVALVDAMEELENSGPELREPRVRDVGNGLKELRVSAREGIARGFFFFHTGRQIFVVHVLQKKTQKTPKTSLELSRERMKVVKRMLE